jgi:hypothetical protein
MYITYIFFVAAITIDEESGEEEALMIPFASISFTYFCIAFLLVAEYQVSGP